MIDTASVYKNEIEIQEGLQGLFDEKKIKREDIFITSKIGPKQLGDCKKVYEDISTKLKTEYLDLLLMHWPGKSKVNPNDIANRKHRLDCYEKME